MNSNELVYKNKEFEFLTGFFAVILFTISSFEPFVFFLIILLILFNKKYFFVLPFALLCFFSTQWLIYSLRESKGLPTEYIQYIKALFFILATLCITINIFKEIRKNDFVFLVLTTITIFFVLFSFIKSPGIVSIKYLINFYLPLFFTILLSHFLCNKGNRQYSFSINFLYGFFFSLGLLYLIGVILNITTGFDFLIYLMEFFGKNRPDSASLPFTYWGEEKEISGGMVSSISGIPVLRNPGWAVDPIAAGYMLATISISIFLFLSNSFKYFLLCTFLLLTTLTYSKGAIFLIILFFSFYSYLFLFNKYSLPLKWIGLLLLITSFLTFFIFYSSDPRGDSSYVHYLGLTEVFSHFPSLIGNGMNSGGNYSNIEFSEKILRGAESSIGVIFYHTGFFGLSSFMLTYMFNIYSLLKYRNKLSRVLISLLASMLILSFLQENIFTITLIVGFLILPFSSMAKKDLDVAR